MWVPTSTGGRARILCRNVAIRDLLLSELPFLALGLPRMASNAGQELDGI
jgi:hypothetical protein